MLIILQVLIVFDILNDFETIQFVGKMPRQKIVDNFRKYKVSTRNLILKKIVRNF